MELLGDVIFHWRDSGPNLIVGALVAIVLAIMGFIASRSSKRKGRCVMVILFGGWILYTAFIFVGSTFLPDEIAISPEGIRGRHNFSRFAVESSNIHSIESTSIKGRPALYVFIKNRNDNVGIPVITDGKKDLYKAALRRVCPNSNFHWY